MPTKAEKQLSKEEVRKICAKLFRTPGGSTLRIIQEVLAEHGVNVSRTSGAPAFRDGPLAEYLQELQSAAQLANDVATIAQNGIGMADGAATAFAKSVFTAAREIKPEEIGSKKANNVSLAISRLKAGDDRAKFLETRIREIEQKLELQQFDAAAAVIEHAKEIKLVIADKSLDGPARNERVRKILFGEKPADFRPITTKGEQAS
jgi:hypothetical protein